MGNRYKEIWEKQWSLKQKDSATLEKAASLFRRALTSRFVSFHITRYFRARGICIECGCGSGETSSRIHKDSFTSIGLDISFEALVRSKRRSIFDHYILGDLFRLPLKDASIDGLWNVGVMEHFTRQELYQIFHEFHRVLKPGGCCILFWPWFLAPSHLILRFYEYISGKLGIRKQIFPPAPSMLTPKSMRLYREIMSLSGFREIRFVFPWIDFTHWAVVGFKK